MLSQSAPALDALALQGILATPKQDIRVLACEKTAGDDRNPVYSYVVANADGDYAVNRVKLTRTGLASNAYRAASKIFAENRVYETMYDAIRVMNSKRVGRYTSLSGPPPLSSAVFSLNEFGIEPSPLLDSVLNDWMQTQTIAPLRYAVYNPQRNEIEVSFVDPSAHNDEPHQLELKEAIGKQLKQLFRNQHSINPDVDSGPSGRYSRRDENRRTYNMSLIRLDLGDDTFQSDSAKKPGYKFARVSGKAEMVLPSAARAGLTEIKGHLKKAKADRTKAMRVSLQHERAAESAKAATNPERKKVLRAKAKTLKTQASALNKSAKAAVTAANKAARSHGLGGLNLPITVAVLGNAKKLAAAKVDEFGVTGKRGTFKPKFTTQAKFDELGSKTAAKPAVKKAPTPAKPIRMMPGAKGGHSAAKEKIARESGLMGKKRKSVVARGPAGGGKQVAGYKAPTAAAIGKMNSSDFVAMSKDEQQAAFKTLGKAISKKVPGIDVKVEGGKLKVGKRTYLVNKGKFGMHDGDQNVHFTRSEIGLAKMVKQAQEDAAFEASKPKGTNRARTSRRSTSASKKREPVKVDSHNRGAFNRIVHDKIKGSLTKQWHYRLYGTKITFINESTRKSFTMEADNLKSEGITSREAAAVARELGIKSA